MRNLESFDVWKHGRELARQSYALTMRAPINKHFGLADQIRRAAVSIPANIAEGYALGTTKQFIRCLRIALGSNSELRSHFDLARLLGLMPESDAISVMDLSDRVLGLLLGLIRKLAARERSRLSSPASRSPR
jgi:four helix bundle protein